MDIYKDISTRTGGEIYIGVVGPVRSGKSTFIKRFMESLVMPNITVEYDRERARDELPQSAGGRTVMTTEPKFVPDEAVEINVGGANVKVRLIDCVGYVIPDALGHIENDEPRMVKTPWRDEPMPFTEAAELGTERVIRDHSTIGMLVTTDGGICELPRENYVEAEERAARELTALGKPFAVILNSASPESEGAIALAHELETKYNAPVALVNCTELDAEDVGKILEMVLLEFPAKEIAVSLPGWTGALEHDHPLRDSLICSVRECAAKIKKTGDIAPAFAELRGGEKISDASVSSIDAGSGTASAVITLAPRLYYDTVRELTGLEIDGEEQLLRHLRSLAETKKEYEKFAAAIDDVNERGYGIVMPEITDMTLDAPEIVKQAGGYGVRLHAKAPSVHMIRATIETEINPIVGTEQQSEDLINYMTREFEDDPARIWESNLFGKSLYELVNEGLHTKLAHMPDDARAKLSETLARIINEGSGGLICIIL